MKTDPQEHNPDNLTPEQYGAPEWRLLLKDEDIERGDEACWLWGWEQVKGLVGTPVIGGGVVIRRRVTPPCVEQTPTPPQCDPDLAYWQAMDWPNPEAKFAVFDDGNPHGKIAIILPGGQLMDCGGHDDPAVDRLRANWMCHALNETRLLASDAELARVRAENVTLRNAQKACEDCDGPTVAEVKELRAFRDTALARIAELESDLAHEKRLALQAAKDK